MATTLVAPTLTRLIQDARILLSQPKAENSRFSDAELSGYANDALQQIFLTVNEYGEGQFDKTTTLGVVNGTETVALPADCFAIKVLYIDQNGVKRRLEYKQNILADYDSGNTNTGSTTYEPYYYLRGNNIVLRPIPGFTSTTALTIEYTAYPTVLVYGADTLDAGISPLFKELIVMYTVSKAKLKDDLSGQGSGYALASSHRDDLFKMFKHQISERSKAPTYITPFEPI